MRLKALSTTKKRRTIANALKDIALRHGATYSEQPGYYAPRSIDWRIEKGDYFVRGDLNGDSRCGAFIGHWNVRSAATYAKFGHNFACATHAAINEFHGQKATTCEDTDYCFLAEIDAGLAVL